MITHSSSFHNPNVPQQGNGEPNSGTWYHRISLGNKKEQTIDNTTQMDLRDKKKWKKTIIPKGCILWDSIYLIVSNNKITEMKNKGVVARG